MASGGLEIRRFAFFQSCALLYQFMRAVDLEVGIKISITRVKGPVRELPITNITEEPYDGFVYDLEIPETRNFAANGVLVHDLKPLSI